MTKDIIQELKKRKLKKVKSALFAFMEINTYLVFIMGIKFSRLWSIFINKGGARKNGKGSCNV